MAVRTRRWTRSPRGRILGVATGLAEWRALPADATRLIVFLLTVCSGFGILIYLGLAVLLPVQTRADIIDTDDWEDNYNDFSSARRRYNHRRNADDASFRETTSGRKSDEDLEKEYEELKKKVEKMESDIFDKEKAWDAKFNSDKKN
ncbi:MAG: PspC domain-containing protein [Spirochaetales bacterium]|nr:PspC domain-containing protein [Candidatus Physcosoma equi]